MAQDPLRQLMSMADTVRTSINAMMGEGARRMQASLPSLPLPTGGGAAPTLPTDILSRLPRIPGLPPTAEAAPTPAPPKITLPTAPTPTRAGYVLRDSTYPKGYTLRR